MSLRSLLAKDWVLEVDSRTSSAAEPQWMRVNGLTSFTETTDDNTEDDAAFEDNGWGSSVVTQPTWSIEAEGRRKRTDATAFTPMPGRRRSARPAGSWGSPRTSPCVGSAGTGHRTPFRAWPRCPGSPVVVRRPIWSRSTSP